MNRFFTLLLAASCLTAVGQVPDYVPTEGMVGWWPFEGSYSNDYSGVTPDEVSEVTFSDGHFGVGQAAFFNDAAYIDLGDMPSPEEFTLTAWIRPSAGALDTWGNVYSDFVSGSGGLALLHSSNQPFTELYSHTTFGADGTCNTGLELEEESWQFVAMTRNTEGEVKIYWNMQLVGNCQSTTSPAQHSQSAFIGRAAHSNNEHWLGEIDDFGFWSRALNEVEMQSLYDYQPQMGCTDSDACNYDDNAEFDDGSCVSCETLATACGVGTTWDAESGTCIVANPSDSNFDGCVQLTDLLDLLSAYGTCGDCGGDCSLANASSTCVDGECVIESCNDGFADYNGEALDGCESEEVPSWSCGEDLVFEGHTYATVQINGQCWFAENLRSTSYANGDAIAGNLNDPAWSTTSSGGRATFGEGASVCYGPAPGGDACNEAFSLASYGRLYNWHAVNDARGLCPSGWHVPSDGEWTTLTDGIGGALTAGNTLKAGSGWFNNGNGSSPNGFDAFPGGQRMNAGNFQGAGTDAFFWTSTALSSVQVWFRSMGWNLPEVVRNPAEKNVGMSVRCLKDAE